MFDYRAFSEAAIRAIEHAPVRHPVPVWLAYRCATHSMAVTVARQEPTIKGC